MDMQILCYYQFASGESLELQGVLFRWNLLVEGSTSIFSKSKSSYTLLSKKTCTMLSEIFLKVVSETYGGDLCENFSESEPRSLFLRIQVFFIRSVKLP